MNKINFKSKKFLLIALAVLLVVGIIAFALLNNNDKNDNQTTNPQPESTSAPYDLSPATEEEKQETEQHKDDIVNQQNQQNNPPSGQKKQVTVVITSADANSINAYVNGVVEENGTCTATLTKGGETVTRTSAGFSNVSTTNCTPITPSFPSSGSWTVTVSYSSQAAEGSAQTTVAVP